MVARCLHRLFPEFLEEAVTHWLCAAGKDAAGIRGDGHSVCARQPARPSAGAPMKIVFAFALVACCSLAHAQSSPPVELTAEQDHQRLLDLLHIQTLRPGANPRD